MGRINRPAQKKKNKVFLNKKRKKQRKEYNLSNKKKKKYIRFFESEEGIGTKTSGLRKYKVITRYRKAKKSGIGIFPYGLDKRRVY